MGVKLSLNEVLRTQYLRVSKKRYSKSDLLNWFMLPPMETSEYWLIPCVHSVHQPATDAQIAALGSELHQALPRQLECFLRLTDGAEFFRLNYQARGYDYWVARYRVLACSELAQVNQQLLDNFRSYAEYDDEYQHLVKLDYIAFCDVGDGDYLAINLQGANTGSVFFLDHEYGSYPLGDRSTKEAYTQVADSIVGWLKRLAQTEGYDGAGGRWIPL